MSKNTAELPVRGHRPDGCRPLLPRIQRRQTMTFGSLYSFRVPSTGHNTVFTYIPLSLDSDIVLHNTMESYTNVAETGERYGLQLGEGHI